MKQGDQSFLAGVASIDRQDRIVLPNLTAGDYVIAVFGDDGSGAELAVTLSSGQAFTAPITLVSLVRVEGLVTDSVGTPLENAEIQFVQNSPRIHPAIAE